MMFIIQSIKNHSVLCMLLVLIHYYILVLSLVSAVVVSSSDNSEFRIPYKCNPSTLRLPTSDLTSMTLWSQKNLWNSSLVPTGVNVVNLTHVTAGTSILIDEPAETLALDIGNGFLDINELGSLTVGLDVGCDECTVLRPCKNGGTCTDALYDYMCACVTGWEGRHCELSTDDCLNNPCFYGTCIDLHLSYRCNCVKGFKGRHCDVPDNGGDTTLPPNTLEKAPNMPNDLTAVVRSTSEIALFWSHPLAHGADISVYQIMVMRDDINSTLVELASVIESISFFIARELDVNSTYKFQVTSVNKLGILSIPANISANTFAGLPPLQPIITVGDVNATIVQVNWHVPRRINGTDDDYPAIVFSFQHGVSGSNLWITDTVRNDTDIIINELFPFQFYDFRVAAKTKISDFGDFSDIVTVRTASKPPVAPPKESVKLTSSSPRSLRLDWSELAVDEEFSSPLADRWHLIGGPIDSQEELTSLYEGVETNFIFEGLIRATNYIFKLRGHNAETTWGTYSDSVVFKTLATIASEVPLLFLSELSDSSFMVSWDAPKDDGGSPVEQFYVTLSNGHDHYTGAQYALFTGLQSHQTYQVRVFARNGIGLSAESPVLQVTTFTQTPRIISIIAADPDDKDTMFSVGDTITVLFDQGTSTGRLLANRKLSTSEVNNIFSFTPLIGGDYIGFWSAESRFVITISKLGELIGTTTLLGKLKVAVRSQANMKNTLGTSLVSSSVSPALVGHWGLGTNAIIQTVITSPNTATGVTIAEGTNASLSFNIDSLNDLVTIYHFRLRPSVGTTNFGSGGSLFSSIDDTVHRSLDSVVYIPPINFYGIAYVEFSIIDPNIGSTLVDQLSIPVEILAVPDAPIIVIPETLESHVGSSPLHGISVGDSDDLSDGSDDKFTLIVSLVVSTGSLDVSLHQNSTAILEGTTPSTSMTLSGSIASVNRVLATLRYISPIDAFTASISISATDPEGLIGTANVPISTDCTLSPAPVLERASMDPTGSRVILEFDGIIAISSGEVSTTCAAIFSGTTLDSFGYSGGIKCVVQDSRIEVVLGSGATVIPGSRIEIRDNIIRRCQTATATSSGSTLLLAPKELLQPRASLVARSTVGPCEDIIVAARANNLGGREATYTWSASDDILGSLLPIASNAKSVRVPKFVLKTDRSYKFSVAVTNFLGARSSTSSATVEVSALSVPVLRILGPKFISTTSAVGVTLEAVASISPCSSPDEVSSENALDYRWSVSPRVPLQITRNYVRVLPQLMRSSSAYTFTASASLRSNDTLRAQASIIVQTISSPLEARISGGSNIIMAAHNKLTLDASESVDPDRMIDDIVYKWSCTSLASDLHEPCFDQSDRKKLAMGDGFRVVLLPGVLSPGRYLFTLNIQKGSRSALATQEVTLKVGLPPSVAIQNTGSDVINSNSKVQLSSLVTNVDEYTDLSYSWSIDELNINSVAGPDSITNSGSLLLNTIEASVWTPGAYYRIRLTVTLTGARTAGVAEYTLRVNLPPSVGDFKVTPLRGYPFSTPFTLSANSWEDTDGPLSYSFFLFDYITQKEIILKSACIDSVMPDVTMPAGNPDAADVITVGVHIRDRLGATETRTSRIYVSPLDFSDNEAIDAFFTQLLNDAHESAILSASDDSLLTTTIASVSSQINGNSGNATNSAGLRSLMVDAITHIASAVPEESVMSNLEAITAVVEQIEPVAIKASVEAMQILIDRHVVSDVRPYSLLNAWFGTLGNLLRAASSFSSPILQRRALSMLSFSDLSDIYNIIWSTFSSMSTENVVNSGESYSFSSNAGEFKALIRRDIVSNMREFAVVSGVTCQLSPRILDSLNAPDDTLVDVNMLYVTSNPFGQIVNGTLASGLSSSRVTDSNGLLFSLPSVPPPVLWRFTVLPTDCGHETCRPQCQLWSFVLLKWDSDSSKVKTLREGNTVTCTAPLGATVAVWTFPPEMVPNPYPSPSATPVPSQTGIPLPPLILLSLVATAPAYASESDNITSIIASIINVDGSEIIMNSVDIRPPTVELSFHIRNAADNEMLDYAMTLQQYRSDDILSTKIGFPVVSLTFGGRPLTTPVTEPVKKSEMIDILLKYVLPSIAVAMILIAIVAWAVSHTRKSTRVKPFVPPPRVSPTKRKSLKRVGVAPIVGLQDVKSSGFGADQVINVAPPLPVLLPGVVNKESPVKPIQQVQPPSVKAPAERAPIDGNIVVPPPVATTAPNRFKLGATGITSFPPPKRAMNAWGPSGSSKPPIKYQAAAENHVATQIAPPRGNAVVPIGMAPSAQHNIPRSPTSRSPATLEKSGPDSDVPKNVTEVTPSAKDVPKLIGLPQSSRLKTKPVQSHPFAPATKVKK